MYGIIRQPRSYADGEPCFEIDIYLTTEEQSSFKEEEKHTLTVIINEERYFAGLLYSENAGYWISPALYNYYNQAEKIRLSFALLKNGYTKNQRVQLTYNSEKKELEVTP